MDYRFTLETPLMWINKAQTWAFAKALGGEALISLIIETPTPAVSGSPRRGMTADTDAVSVRPVI